MSWIICPVCEKSDKVEIEDRMMEIAECVCKASDLTLIYNQGDEILDCECDDEQLEDHYRWLLYCNRCMKHFERLTELDRY